MNRHRWMGMNKPKMWFVYLAYAIAIYLVSIGIAAHDGWWIFVAGIGLGIVLVGGLRTAYVIGAQAAYEDAAAQLEALGEDMVLIERERQDRLDDLETHLNTISDIIGPS